MRTSAIVLALVLASVGCFSTAPYDAAHFQRVTSIHARYEAEVQREQQRHTALVFALDQRRAAIASQPRSDPAALRAIDDEARQLVVLHAQVSDDLARAHQRELDGSRQQRTVQIDAARAVRRARVRAAAIAATSRHTNLPLVRCLTSPHTADGEPASPSHGVDQGPSAPTSGQ